MIKWQDTEAPARSLSLAECPDAPEAASAAVMAGADCVVLRRSCFQSISEHLGKAREERGGLLLGNAWHAHEDADIHLIDIVSAVPAPTAEGTAISLSMGSDLWTAARSRAAEISEPQQAARIVVGWYHSHPGLGAFFSATDQQTQADFFQAPWHIALVVDPLAGQLAWFKGRESASVPDKAVVIL